MKNTTLYVHTSSRLLALVLAMLLLLLPTYSLASDMNSSEALTKVTVSEVTHSVFYAPQYVAINLCFFEKNGIEIELINSQGADKVMAAVLSGQVEIGFAGPEASQVRLHVLCGR